MENKILLLLTCTFYLLALSEKKVNNKASNIIWSFQNKLNLAIRILHLSLSILLIFHSLLMIDILYNIDNKFVVLLSKLFFSFFQYLKIID